MHKEVGPQDPGYETRDVQGRLVIWSFIALAVIVVICVFTAALLFNTLSKSIPVTANLVPSQVAPQRVLPPAPRLQASPPLELKEFRENEDSILTTYGWVDKNTQKVRIPVERALDLISERGLPYHKQGEPLPAVPSNSQVSAAKPLPQAPAPAPPTNRPTPRTTSQPPTATTTPRAQ